MRCNWEMLIWGPCAARMILTSVALAHVMSDSRKQMSAEQSAGCSADQPARRHKSQTKVATSREKKPT